MNPLCAKGPYPLAKVFTGKVPFSDLVSAAATAMIIEGRRPERPAHPGLTEPLWTLIQWCWTENPQDRPWMDRVIEQLSVFSLQLHEKCLIH